MRLLKNNFVFKLRRNAVAAAHDAFMAGASFVLAVYLRLGPDQMETAGYLKFGTLFFVAICVAVFTAMRLYRGLWRYASMRDMVAIFKSVTLAILIFAACMFIINRLENVPRSLFFINWMLLLFMLGGPRFAYRAIRDRTLYWSLRESSKIPVLLVGATDNAERFIRDMARDTHAPYEVVAIADSDPGRKGRTIHGIPIYDSIEWLHIIVAKLARKGKRPLKLILTDDKASGASVRHLLDIADTLGIPLARLPRTSEFRAKVNETPDIQAIEVGDILMRSQNVLDRDAMRRLVEGKKVLVTGAGGTIGGELTRQVAACRPASLLLLEMSEFNLYQIEREIRAAHPAVPVTALLADVRDAEHIDHIFAFHQPQLVFHAAAIKHVPMAEGNVEETVLTNVFGTCNIAESCRTYQASVMVMISTDKAVNPSNVMGATKRLAENFCQAIGEAPKSGHCKFITVRFGNVLGSTGSVVPLFQEQIAKGGPVTITHPDMTRYFMTVREAVELVLEAAALGASMKERQECIFVLDMGQPVRIFDLAMQMIRLAGLKPHEDIKVTYTGLRPGEKLYEELFHFSENAVKTSHEGIFLSQPRFTDLAILRKSLERLLAACRHHRPGEARALLKQLVPEFAPKEEARVSHLQKVV